VFKKIAFLSAANLVGPFLVLLTTPILSRLYGPESLGGYYWVITLAMFFSVIVGLQIFNQILSESDTDVANLKLIANLVLIVFFSVFIGGFSAVLGWFFSLDLELVLSVICAALLIAVNQVFFVYISRSSKVSTLVRAGIIRAITISVCPVLLGVIWGDDQGFLVFSYIFAEFVVSTFFVCNIGVSVFVAGFEKKERFFQILYEGVDFAKYYLPSQLISNFTNSAVIFLVKLESLHVLGLYSMLYRLVGTPVYSIGNAVRSIFYVHVMKMKTGKVVALIAPVVGVYLSVFCFFYLYSFSSVEFVVWLLGDSWRGIDVYLPFFVLWLGVSLANMLPAEILKHSGFQRKILKWEGASSGLKLAVLFSFSILDIKEDILVLIPASYFLIGMIGTVYFMRNAIEVLRHET